ncbi:sarcosine oxidase subunit gamma [Citricoccus sp. GCM10030269]
MADTMMIASDAAESESSANNAAAATEVDALRVSPAAHLAEMMAAATVEGERSVALREIRFAVQLGVRVLPGTPASAAVEAALGLALPRHHGEVTGDSGGLHGLWLGPDEFLVVDVSRHQRPGDSDAAAAALDGTQGEASLPGQVLDLSANRTILELSGASARAVLEKGCHYDLHPRAFGVGMAIATQLGPVPVILHRSGDREFRLYPRASFADYLVHWLLDAMEEFAAEEVL